MWTSMRGHSRLSRASGAVRSSHQKRSAASGLCPTARFSVRSWQTTNGIHSATSLEISFSAKRMKIFLIQTCFTGTCFTRFSTGSKIPRPRRSAGFHAFRHSAAGLISNRTGNLKLTQNLLGHSNLSTTAGVYTHTSTEAQRGASVVLEHAVFGNLFPKGNRNSSVMN